MTTMETVYTVLWVLALLLCCVYLGLGCLVMYQKLEENEFQRRKDRLAMGALEDQVPYHPMCRSSFVVHGGAEDFEDMNLQAMAALKNLQHKKFRKRKPATKKKK